LDDDGGLPDVVAVPVDQRVLSAEHSIASGAVRIEAGRPDFALQVRPERQQLGVHVVHHPAGRPSCNDFLACWPTGLNRSAVSREEQPNTQFVIASV
jgi:hypothetical protein